jgi:hypothetical protein
MNDIPLIYTSRGNLPIDSLKYETEWDITPMYYKFVERYRADDGEIVKESAHAYSLAGVTGAGIPGQF